MWLSMCPAAPGPACVRGRPVLGRRKMIPVRDTEVWGGVKDPGMGRQVN